MERCGHVCAPEEGCWPIWIQKAINYMTEVKNGSDAVKSLPHITGVVF